MEKTEQRRIWLIRAGTAALLAAGAWLALRLLSGAAAPFLIAFAAAWVLHRPAEWLSRRTRIPQKAAAALTVLAGLTALGGALAGLCVLFAGEAGMLLGKVPDFVGHTLPELRRGMEEAAVGRLCAAYLRLSALTFVLLAVLLKWWVRADGAIVLAAVIAAVDLLPVLGCGTVLLPWAAGCAITGDGAAALRLLLTYAAVLVTRGVAEPRLIGGSVGLHPAASLLCVCVGLRLFGWAGMVLLPMAVMILREMHKAGTLRLWK